MSVYLYICIFSLNIYIYLYIHLIDIWRFLNSGAAPSDRTFYTTGVETNGFGFSIFEGSLEVKLLTIWTDRKAEVGRIREEKRRRTKIREEKEPEERRCRCAKK